MCKRWLWFVECTLLPQNSREWDVVGCGKVLKKSSRRSAVDNRIEDGLMGGSLAQRKPWEWLRALAMQSKGRVGMR